jgi:hypothetical protein
MIIVEEIQIMRTIQTITIIQTIQKTGIQNLSLRWLIPTKTNILIRVGG